MMKLGKALAVMDVAIRSDGDERLVAHAVVTYSVPTKE
jgi:acyl-coenzyme A thioesterase PaaI-like protein